MKLFVFRLFLTGILIVPRSSFAFVEVPSMFSNHAVLQREMSLPVWGTAAPGEVVEVSFSGQNEAAAADASGNWEVSLGPMDANSTANDLVITGSSNTITITDVLVGEVWVGSGQSNMQRTLVDDCDAPNAIADADSYTYMRFFDVTKNSGNVANTVWEISSETTAPDMSAVHFYFGRHLAQNVLDASSQHVPMGMITSAVGATAIKRWATCAGSGSLYTGQIVPLQPYGIRGITWYQGEWDARGGAEKYYGDLPCLISEWRSDWGQGDFPFYIVQMPKMGISKIHIVRDAELQTASNDANVEMIVTIDLPGSDVHPPCKDPFGVRLAMLAREFEYGHLVSSRSPVPNEAASYVSQSSLHVVFDNVAGGLQSSGGNLNEWEIAGTDGIYVAADAVIEAQQNDTVVVSSASIVNPVSARYAFEPNPVSNNLVNSVGLPASPIREVKPGSSSSWCGDGTCNSGEDQCTCATDCGLPPPSETNCDDGIDNDCDGLLDCDDPDCSNDVACLPPTCNSNGVCDAGEDCNSCPDDCSGNLRGKPSSRYCCGNGEQESPETEDLCDGNF